MRFSSRRVGARLAFVRRLPVGGTSLLFERGGSRKRPRPRPAASDKINTVLRPARHRAPEDFDSIA